MSTTTGPARNRSVRSTRYSREPPALTILEFGSTGAVVLLIVLLLAFNQSGFLAHFPEVLPWLVVVALADLMPVPIWGSVELMMSFPVLLASAFVFPPYVVGSLAFLGSMDLREIRREIPLGRALFNRSNVALSVIVASFVFHTLEGEILVWPEVLAPASAALAVDFLINASLLILGTWLLTGLPLRRLIRNVYGGSQPTAFLGGYACFGLMALVLATVYLAAGAWGLVAFAIPVLLARQMFIHWKALAVARLQLHEERRLLSHVSTRIADERRDERLAVAAGIHDDVLPPLTKVHLMGQVLRQDLVSGRLLDLEVDLPDLLRATEAASLAFRDLIRDLRESTVGPGGLVHTLGLLVRTLSEETDIRFQLEAEPVPGTPLTHLLIYQVAREALANVVRHSHAEMACISLEDAGDHVRLIIDDDGEGFEPLAVDSNSHFGLQLMRERVELAGGSFHLEASTHRGTRVTVTVPVERPTL